MSIQSFVLKRCASAPSCGFPAHSNLKCCKFNGCTKPGCAGGITGCSGGAWGTIDWSGGTGGTTGGSCGAGGPPLAICLYFLW